MTYIDDLTTARDNLAARIKDLTAQPKPNYSIDGQTVSWGDYLRQLLALDGLAELVKVVLGFRQIGLHQRAAGVEELAVKARAEGRVLRQRRHLRGQLAELIVQRL